MKVLLVVSVFLYTIAMLYLSGFCFSQMRWLSTQEKMDLGVHDVLNSGDFSSRYVDIDGISKQREPRPIAYKNVTEFYKANQNCCDVVSSDPDGFQPAMIDRLTGHASCMLRIRYSVEYIDKMGRLSRGEPQISYPVIKNCGLVWSGI